MSRSSSRQRQPIRPSDAVEVRRSPRHGQGIFATRDIAAGELIEECPALLFDDEQWHAIDAGGLHGYCYEAPRGGVVLALGMGSLYNHASQPNADYTVRLRPPRVLITAAGPIRADDEVTISYGRPDELWFDAR